MSLAAVQPRSSNASNLGWVLGGIGVAIFSASLVATRAGVAEFEPVFFTATRAVLAALFAAVALLAFSKARPSRADFISLFWVALGVVVGFPLLTSLALQHVTAAHSTVFIGLLPLSTALFGVWRTGDRPRPAFWVAAIIGSAFVVGFALLQGGSSTLWGDLMMFGAIIICGLGYAEGAKISRHLGGWQTISWALLISVPVTLPIAILTAPTDFANITLKGWSALGYVSMFSMFIGFFFWYRGLALGGVAAVGQLQLLQPFLGFLLAALILGEAISPLMLAVSLFVLLCVWVSKKFG
jgi:drug/metabolite transporter (DMT)-like permease